MENLHQAQLCNSKNDHLQRLTDQDIDKLPNVSFYLGNRRITRQKLSIDDIHLDNANYEWLQRTHDYVQWVFPNFYKSQFNSQSEALTKLQASFFRSSKIIGRKMLKSFKMYCDFIGIKVDTRTMQFQIICPIRAVNALKKNKHNHLRIKRILASLSVTGFRPIALEFLKMLQNLITTISELKYDPSITNALEKEWKFYSDEIFKNVETVDKDIIADHNPILEDYLQFRNNQVNKQEGKQFKEGILSDNIPVKTKKGRVQNFLQDQAQITQDNKKLQQIIKDTNQNNETKAIIPSQNKQQKQVVINSMQNNPQQQESQQQPISKVQKQQSPVKQQFPCVEQSIAQPHLQNPQSMSNIQMTNKYFETNQSQDQNTPAKQNEQETIILNQNKSL